MPRRSLPRRQQRKKQRSKNGSKQFKTSKRARLRTGLFCVWSFEGHLRCSDGSGELSKVPALVPDVVLDKKAQRDGRVVADSAACFQALSGYVVDHGGQNLVLHFPPEQQSLPRLAGIAVRGDPCILRVLRPYIGAARGGADKALAVVGC